MVHGPKFKGMWEPIFKVIFFKEKIIKKMFAILSFLFWMILKPIPKIWNTSKSKLVSKVYDIKFGVTERSRFLLFNLV